MTAPLDFGIQSPPNMNSIKSVLLCTISLLALTARAETTIVTVDANAANTPLMSKAPAPGEKQFPYPQVIRYDGHCLTINGKDTFIRSAAFHYFRTPRELWRDRFQKIKDAGFNTVETY